MALLLFGLHGCGIGLLYTDVTHPLVTNMSKTPNPERTKTATLDQDTLEEPFTGLGVRVEVDSIAIGEAAKKAGIQEIYYADLRTVSVLFGIYQRRTVIVTGE